MINIKTNLFLSGNMKELKINEKRNIALQQKLKYKKPINEAITKTMKDFFREKNIKRC